MVDALERAGVVVGKFSHGVRLLFQTAQFFLCGAVAFAPLFQKQQNEQHKAERAQNRANDDEDFGHGVSFVMFFRCLSSAARVLRAPSCAQ